MAGTMSEQSSIWIGPTGRAKLWGTKYEYRTPVLIPMFPFTGGELQNRARLKDQWVFTQRPSDAEVSLGFAERKK